jgi:succinate dehydrogenase/fumarate reductase flavoprotein subunit
MIPQSVLMLRDGTGVPVYRLNTVIVGAGAAGMNCAVHLFEFLAGKGVTDAKDRIAVVTGGVRLGASRMSGSDKQTYYKMGTSPKVADSPMDFIKALTSFGCMHGDLALAEGENSLREFYHLVQAGVPFPHDPEGAYVGYKTDHDPYERATSAGPKTSKFMSECLSGQARRYGIKVFDRHEAAHLLTAERDGVKRVVGLVTLDKRWLARPDRGVTIFLCENIVLAAGGPGELYEVSVYPRGQVGLHGLAFRAGLKANNMTEWQFGLASTKFRWNVSGTYMQVVPRIYSTNSRGGDEREFLAPHFPTTAKMATNIFLKGYQWPFDAQRVLDYQSSLVDILVTQERARGRRVWMDFLRNPALAEGKEPFDLRAMAPEALTYLERNGAMQPTPIERLAHMNTPAIEIYSENGIDLYKEPLEIDVCAQHHNGGFAVNKWWESSVPHAFVIGEMAGTHGVKRPGGAALNSGQAGGLRAAEYIANAYGGEAAAELLLGDSQRGQIEWLLGRLGRHAEGSTALSAKEAFREIQQSNSWAAAHMRDLRKIEKALEAGRERLAAIRGGLSLAKAADLVTAVRAEHMAVTQIALLEALTDYLNRGGGSRGSYMVLREDGQVIKEDVTDPETKQPYRFIPENEALRAEIQEIELVDDEQAEFKIGRVAPRPAPKRDVAFEKMWTEFRAGEIYKR